MSGTVSAFFVCAPAYAYIRAFADNINTVRTGEPLLGCEVGMDTPSVYKKIKAFDGCNRGTLRYLMGHTHCNKVAETTTMTATTTMVETRGSGGQDAAVAGEAAGYLLGGTGVRGTADRICGCVYNPMIDAISIFAPAYARDNVFLVFACVWLESTTFAIVTYNIWLDCTYVNEFRNCVHPKLNFSRGLDSQWYPANQKSKTSTMCVFYFFASRSTMSSARGLA